jgi:hypothetical protein
MTVMCEVQKHKFSPLISNHLCLKTYYWQRHFLLSYFSGASWGNYSTAEDMLMNSALGVQGFCAVNFGQGSQDLSYGLNLPDIQSCMVDGGYKCPNCDKLYRWKNTLLRHLRLECGKEPQFHCLYCPYSSKRKGNLQKHVTLRHHKLLWIFICFSHNLGWCKPKCYCWGD